MKRVAVVGGGAAGMVSAVVAARRGLEVVLYEADERIGRKVLASGNGKCNLSNRRILSDSYNDPAAARLIESVGELKVEEFFEGIGVPLRADREGRVYPYAEQSSCVLNALREELGRLHVTIKTNAPVRAVERASRGGFFVAENPYDAVVWATGSPATFGRDSLDVLKGLGLPVRPFRPSLAPLLTEKFMLTGLKGVRVKAVATLLRRGKAVAQKEGEVLFKDNGVSGIAIFDLSAVLARAGGSGYAISLDMFPDMTEERLASFLSRGGDGVCHKAILYNVKKQEGLYDTRAIARGLKAYVLNVLDVGHISLAQAAGGGVPLSALTDTLEAKGRPGLYVVGEAADVDGQCGGYNLLWAWVGGMLAGGAV